METHIQQHQKNKENEVEKQNINEGGKHSATASPSSSPSHEFSFTISLHSSSTTTTTKPPPPSLALDLSPADDIFFHGHLLPLQLLSHFPSSPRFSTNSSIDSFSLPIRDLLLQDENNTSNREHSINNVTPTTRTTKEGEEEIKCISKPAGFSMFGSTRGRNKEEKNNKRKIGYDHVINAMKKYLRMVLFRGRREKDIGLFQGQAYSRSGNIMRKSKPEMRGRNSAPASMRTSPTNSGLLFATAPTASNDSTMEELQAAIQAAIAHCKNSIAKEDNLISS